jgi:hypothetical protein
MRATLRSPDFSVNDPAESNLRTSAVLAESAGRVPLPGAPAPVLDMAATLGGAEFLRLDPGGIPE